MIQQSFDMLSPPIRKYIYEKGWGSLRPIQDAAIKRIIPTDNNYVLISRTASGKTEAAFLPILSKVNFKEQGVKVLYISPLIALINDQFLRVEKLCEYLDVPVTKWHGEASKGAKDRLVKNPEGIVLITPESIEAMFVNKPYYIRHLFSNLEYIVIDEIHSFLGSDRGIQLQSLLNRLQRINNKKFSIVGLSATVSDVNQYVELKEFLGNSENTKIIRDTTPKPINAVFKYFETSTSELPSLLLDDIYSRTRDRKTLIFPNARGRVEEVAVKLKKTANRLGGHTNYFSHHSSVDKEVREYVELFAKNSTGQNFCISCTSTLELGIDIGNVDEVVQIDATHSIASLIQRVGRSGRREGKSSNLFLYATDPWSLLQSLACWLLYKEQYIEPISVNKKPYDILVHQILSVVKGSSGISLSELTEQFTSNSTFSDIEYEVIIEIINHLTAIDFLEKLGNEYIVGIEGEKLVNTKDFYILFKTEILFKVSNQGVKIGELPLSPKIDIDENIYLSAKIWKIKNIDFDTKKIEVIPAYDGDKPLFDSEGGLVSSKIKEKMLEILTSDEKYDLLDSNGQLCISDLQSDFVGFSIVDSMTDRPLRSSNENLFFYPFIGSKIVETLKFVFEKANISFDYYPLNDEFKMKMLSSEFIARVKNIDFKILDTNEYLHQLIKTSPEILDFSKWGKFLPIQYQIELLKNNYYDFEGCQHFLQNLNFIEN
ncbi:DEAD/DEAH box helicase [Chryseobacterium sp. MYb264]|uniref:DEAD/DEAH box helicase n=1 Tax=Chryseobacterium sp. MYb264 TaxID=2745153 RepID=UPI002E13B5D0|nr:DEAD/DEAH box helicase [Chryseobacterium sp. MYb264]